MKAIIAGLAIACIAIMFVVDRKAGMDAEAYCARLENLTPYCAAIVENKKCEKRIDIQQ